MEGFDPVAMSYLAVNAPLHTIPTVPINSNHELLIPIDNLSNFDNETYVGSEDASQYGQHLMQPPLTPSLKRLSGTYEDGFSDHLSQYEPPYTHDPAGVDSPSIDRDHRLLNFSPPSSHLPLLDYAHRQTSISISAQLHGMFFLAESPWANNMEGVAPPAELTCYRRNLFQVTGNVIIPKGLRYVVTEQGEQVQILGQELVITAAESVEQNPVKIISVPWKTPATTTPAPEDKTEKEPTTIPLDIASGQEIDAEYTSIPIAWKRLQFRSATANNGRRKELQQHFVVHLKVMATLANGSKTSLCEVISNAIIVRGRSPRNFQSRKDMPISGSASTGRKNNSITMPQPSRASTGDSSHIKHDTRPMSTSIELPNIPFAYDPSEMQLSPDFFEWQIPPGQMSAMTTMVEPGPFTPHENGAAAALHPAYAHSTPDLSRTRYTQDPMAMPPRSHHRHTHSVPRAPVALSLTEDLMPSPTSLPAQPLKRSPTSAPAPIPSNHHQGQHIQKAPRLSHTPSFGLNVLSSPSDDSADQLYEYFPLGLDDWTLPVDAVYRPHVVHHTNLPADPGAGMKSGFFGGAGLVGAAIGGPQVGRARSKRYFSEEGA